MEAWLEELNRYANDEEPRNIVRLVGGDVEMDALDRATRVAFSEATRRYNDEHR